MQLILLYLYPQSTMSADPVYRQLDDVSESA